MPETKLKPSIEDHKILALKKIDRYKTVDELTKKSQPGSVYYTLLIISSIIVASGLLLNNSTIVIGGMLIAPVITPLLMISLGLAIGRIDLIKNVANLLGKSFLIIFLASFFLSLIFPTPLEEIQVFSDSMQSAVLYFIVAMASGVAATFGWARKDFTDVLPGIAIAVSLVPPISLLGVGLSVFDFALMQVYFVITFLNFVGILIGSIVVFSLLKFQKVEKKVEKEIKEQEKVVAAVKEEKEKEREKEKATK